MTQKFPLLFAPFRLRKHGLRSRIIVTGHAGKRTKLGYRVLKPTLARHQLTFYHRPLTETNSVAWLVRAA